MALELIDSWVAQGWVDAAAAVVVARSGVLERRTAGAAGHDSLFALASVTKPIVALAVLTAAEEGVLALDAPVAEHLAEYRDPPRSSITARHLLSHASGLPESARGVSPLEVLPTRPPETRRVYSNVGFHVLGRLLAAATEMPYHRYTHEAVVAPLGMDSYLPLPERDETRALPVRDPGMAEPGVQLFNDRRWRARASAAGGAFATAGAIGRLVSVILTGGAPLLHEQTLAEFATVQFPGLDGGLESVPWLRCPDWGLGVNVRGGGSLHWVGDSVSPSTLSHYGASGTLFWADPVRGLGLVCLAARGAYSGWMFQPGGWSELSQRVMAEHDPR